MTPVINPLAILSGMDPQHTSGLNAAPPPSPSDIALERELDRVYPLLRTKVNNFLGAIAGGPPDEDTEFQTYRLLENVFDVEFSRAVREYIKYKQANPIRRALTDVGVQHAINSKADSYIGEVLQRIPQYEQELNSPDADPGSAYQRSVLSGLRNVLQDKNIANTVIKHMMDFRKLEQPIPFVQSKVKYLEPSEAAKK